MKLVARLRSVSIAVRLAVMVALVLVGSMASFGVVSLVRQRAQALDVVRWDAQRLVESLERALRAQMLAGHAQLADSVTGIVRPGRVDSATLIDHRGRIRHSTDAKLIGTVVAPSNYRCAECHSGGAGRLSVERAPVARVDTEREVTSAVYPIRGIPACFSASCHVHSRSRSVLGVLQIEVPFGEVSRALAGYRDQIIVLSLIIVSVSALVVLLLIRLWVARPVASLLSGTWRVASGDLTHAITVGDGDLGQLARAFNTMQERLRSSQRQLLMAEKLASVGRLAAGVAHEINSPLTGILTYAEDLSEHAAADDPRRSDYEVIRHEAERCREIVRNLLEFARQEPPALRPVDVETVLDRTFKLVAKLALFREVVLTREAEEGLPRVLGDAGQLQQVFLNLMVNAAEAMPHGGPLVVRAAYERQAGLVRVDFQDTGEGIPEEIIGKIFEPFFSTKGGRTNGLGLSVCWGIVEQHGGRLEVESRVGQGATFHVFLPRAPAGGQ